MKNITQPRYLVIADYPKSIYKIGEILECGLTYQDLLFADREGPRMSQYPHLFRLLHWWEFRDEKEMGGYFIGKWRGDAYYIKVDNWVKEGTIFNAKVGDINFVADYCTPITESQYNEYIKTK